MPNWPQQPPMGTQLRWGDSLLDGLVAYWPFWEGSGDKVFDLSGNGHTGTLVDMPPATAWLAGENGDCLNFDAVDDIVNCGSGTSLNITGALSVSALVKFPALSGSAMIADKGCTGGNYGYTLFANSAENFCWGNANVGYRRTTAGNYHGSRHHVTGVHTGGNNDAALKLYVDGVEPPTEMVGVFSGFESSGQPLAIGGNYDDGVAEHFFSGQIACVLMHNRALSLAESQRLHTDPWAMFRSPTEWFPAAVAGVTAPTAVLDGPLVGSLGGPI